MDSLNGQLVKAQAELEHLRLRLSVREDSEQRMAAADAGETEQLRHTCKQLEKKLKVCMHACMARCGFYLAYFTPPRHSKGGVSIIQLPHPSHDCHAHLMTATPTPDTL